MRSQVIAWAWLSCNSEAELQNLREDNTCYRLGMVELQRVRSLTSNFSSEGYRLGMVELQPRVPFTLRYYFVRVLVSYVELQPRVPFTVSENTSPVIAWAWLSCNSFFISFSEFQKLCYRLGMVDYNRNS